MNGQEPAITQQDPRAYYLWLQSQRIPAMQAVQMVEQRFGAPKTPEQRAREQAGQGQSNALAQTAGTIGGLLVTQEALRNFPNVRELFKQPTYDPSGSIGITRPVPGQTLDLDALASEGTPKVVSIQGDTATVKLPNGKVDTLPTEALNDPTFMKSVNWDAVGSGGMAALSAYQAYKSYQSGDKLGAGISGASAVALGTQAANQAGMSFAGSQSIGAAAPYLGAAAGAYQGYQTAQMIGDTAAGSQRTRNAALGGAASGAMIGGSLGGPIGLAIGAAVGGLAGAVGSWTGSKKGKAQFMRDNIRGVLQQNNVLDKDFKGTLADGSNYDFGKDGSTLKWKEIDKIAEKQPTAWNATVPLTDALAAAYGFVGQKASDISAWYAKGAVSNAKDDANVGIKNAQHFAQQQGITFDQIKTKLDEAIKDERINQNQYDYYLGGARQLTAGVQPQKGPQTRPPAPLPPTEAVPAQAKPSFQDLARGNIKAK
jgi:hypothetical protein